VLNLKPDEYREIISEQTGVPPKALKAFHMPIFEGANAPAPDEIESIVNWLREQGYIAEKPAFEEMINSDFLPDPKDVGFAFCCR
jgi:hypothetical protein